MEFMERLAIREEIAKQRQPARVVISLTLPGRRRLNELGSAVYPCCRNYGSAIISNSIPFVPTPDSF
jgi:hypothetical protein